MSGKKQEEISQESVLEEAYTEPESSKSFFEVYTPLNILREVKLRLTGK